MWKRPEHVESGGQHGGDDVQIGFPDIGTDDFDFRAALGSEGLEETGKRAGVAVPDDAEEAFAAAVNLIDQRYVFVPFAVGDLIDPDGGGFPQPEHLGRELALGTTSAMIRALSPWPLILTEW